MGLNWGLFLVPMVGAGAFFFFSLICYFHNKKEAPENIKRWKRAAKMYVLAGVSFVAIALLLLFLLPPSSS